MAWQKNVTDFCKHYNIPINFLAETLNEPKVVPMIRGKAFEFSVYERLLNILNPKIWLVEKPTINAQFGQHDEDVRITHKKSGVSISVECKLAAKGRFRKHKDGSFSIPIKCMRSRTLGDARIAQLAPIIGVTEKVLKVHNDQHGISVQEKLVQQKTVAVLYQIIPRYIFLRKKMSHLKMRQTVGYSLKT